MGSIIRLLVGVPIAAAVTFLLFQLMIILIFEEGVQQEEAPEELRIAISEQVDDIDVRQREVTLDDVDQVDPPPPPPQIERQVAEQPSEDMNTVGGELPDFETPEMSGDNVNFNVSDRDAQPMVRIPPQYPPRALERGTEGSCTVMFDVAPDGTPTNITPTNCPAVFERSTVRAVERWRYEPKVQDGTAVWRRGVVTQLDYQLDE